MGLFWTFIFAGFLIYLSSNLVLAVEDMDDWLRVLYFVVLIPGYSLVIFQIRMYFKNEYKSESML